MRSGLDVPGNLAVRDGGSSNREGIMTDITIAREAAAKAQANAEVAAMIRSGKYDAWPNVQAALNAIRAVRAA